MLIILLLFALTRTLNGAPLRVPDRHPALDIHDIQGHFGQRSVNDIVISCFATLYACTWSAIHPNIPAPTDSWWTCFKRQIVTMIYALLAPELITTWALRQRLAARRIRNEYNKKIKIIDSELEQQNECKLSCVLDNIRALFQDQSSPPAFQKGRIERWTLTHGFFLQMGGFMLCEDGRPIQTLADAASGKRDRRPPLADSGGPTTLMWNIDNDMIDPPRITAEDINDRSKGDAISKAFVILQTTWFIAQCLARWSNRLAVTELEVVTLAFATLNGITYGLWWYKPQNVGRPVFLESKKPRASYRDSSSSSMIPRHAKESRLRLLLRQDIKDLAPSAPWMLLGRIPRRILRALIAPMTSLVGNTPSAVRESDLRVSMFHAAFTDADGQTIVAFTAIGALFGIVHLIPSWFLDYSSRQEMWLWRASAIVVTALPIFVSVMTRLATQIDDFQIFFLFMFIAVPFYVCSRIALLTIPLISLHSLTPTALQTVDWTTFIPHL
ncbi:hypothetical protein BJ912DRAFT_1048178 [Pholiota molesta]|nr:hypothetical protein BJ912DRAFT_1048178 [Pholiota molesta]